MTALLENPGLEERFAAASRAVQEAAVFVPAPESFDALVVHGPDARRFLHGYTTCEVRQASPGSLIRGYFLEMKGHVLAEGVFAVMEEGVRVVLPQRRGLFLRQHLERYVVVDRVTFEGPFPLFRGVLVGPDAASWWGRVGMPAIAIGEAKTLDPEKDLLAASWARGGVRRLEVWAKSPDDFQGVKERLEKAKAPQEVVAPSEWFDIWRVEQGELQFGRDYGEDAFPQELGDPETISFQKGCYLGQEVVARIHYRGGVQRQARGLRFAPGGAEPGTPLFFEGREAGRVGSVVRSPRWGTIGLALLHRRIGEPPTRVHLPGGESVEVVALPFR
jgi:folate-binding protein YgfZ